MKNKDCKWVEYGTFNCYEFDGQRSKVKIAVCCVGFFL